MYVSPVILWILCAFAFLGLTTVSIWIRNARILIFMWFCSIPLTRPKKKPEPVDPGLSISEEDTVIFFHELNRDVKSGGGLSDLEVG
jgi:hypothetical protein